jgi:hypothetical protein
VITLPPVPAEADQLPPILQPFGAVPALVTDISLSVDDRDLYVSCWGTGELKRYDVSDPRNPRETATVKLGGIVITLVTLTVPSSARSHSQTEALRSEVFVTTPTKP